MKRKDPYLRQVGLLCGSIVVVSTIVAIAVVGCKAPADYRAPAPVKIADLPHGCTVWRVYDDHAYNSAVFAADCPGVTADAGGTGR